MKRPMLGGALRGPVAPSRQRRTIRLVQLLLLFMAAGLVVFAVTSATEVATYDPAGLASFERPRPPSVIQPVVLGILAVFALGAAASLGIGRTVNLPTPARLDELVGRAEGVAIERAERSATETAEETAPS